MTLRPHCSLAECCQTRSTRRGIMSSLLVRRALIMTRSTLADLLIVHLYNASKCKRACNLPKGKYEAHFVVSPDSWAALNDDTHKSRNDRKDISTMACGEGNERPTRDLVPNRPANNPNDSL
jgi:hypothetical protein